MGGGLLQLSAVGAEDSYLSGNPQITFFKTIYRKYTNFSMEFISDEFKGSTTLSETTKTKFKCKINRNADLIGGLYFRFHLPNIFSSSYDNTTLQNNPQNQKFKWIKNIGTTIISQISISIGGQIINTFDGEWLNVWSELNLTESAKKTYNEMIGNVPEIFDPQNAPGNNSFYPSSSLDPEQTVDPEDYTKTANPYRAPPSILARDIIVPIPFWFCNHNGQALPLIALQYNDVELELELRPLIDLYSIVETNIENEETYLQYVKPDPSRVEQRISNFLSETLGSEEFSLFYKTYSSTETTQRSIDSRNYKDIMNNKSFTMWDFNPIIDINYIFLEETERKRFSKVSHEYLIEQVNKFSFTGLVNDNYLDIPALHPTKNIVLTAKRSDVTLRNDWNNYTNWKLENISPWSPGTIDYKNILKKYNTPTTIVTLSDKTNNIFANKGNMQYFEQNIIKNITILFNGVQRESKKKYNFFNLVQPYYNLISSPKTGICLYSFSLKESQDFQPKGSCNFSRLKNIQLAIELIDAPINNNTTDNTNNKINYEYKYDINVYTTNYNILRIMGGMGNLAFSS